MTRDLRRFRVGFYILLLGLAPLVCIQKALANEVFRLCTTSASNLPFMAGVNREADSLTGILDEITIQALDRVGLLAKRVYRPWNRCLFMLRSGEADGMVGVSWTPERAQWLHYPADKSHYVWQGNYSVFVRKGSSLRWNGERFSGVRSKLSAPLGYVVAERLKSMGLLVSGHIPPERGMVMVAHNRLDGYVVEENIGWAFVRQIKLQYSLDVLPQYFARIPWYLPLSADFYSNYPQLSERLWDSLVVVRKEQSGVLSQRYQLVAPLDAAF